MTNPTDASKYPTVADYKDYVSIPQSIKDEVIKRGSPELNEKGNPFCVVGGFAATFKFSVSGENKAFRCWIDNNPGDAILNRLKCVGEYLENVNLPYFTDFACEKEGILVNGKPYPTVRMGWVEGEKLDEYIYHHREDVVALKSLAANFLKMCGDLHKNHIAHGDLQHGNVLIGENGKIFLIDYDTVYVPIMGDKERDEDGQAGYQHPKRKVNRYANEKLDYFSELVIYLSIIAVSEKKDLTDFFIVDGNTTEHLLFSAEDFKDIRSSKIYGDLSKLSPKVRMLLGVLEDYLKKNDINDLTPFTATLEPPEIRNLSVVETVYTIGSKVTIHWSTSVGVNLTLDGKDVSGKESTTYIVGKNTSVELIASNGSQSVSKRIDITPKPLPNVLLFKSDKQRVREESSVTVNLDYKNTKKVILQSNMQFKEDVTSRRTITLTPKIDEIFTLVCESVDPQVTVSQTLDLKAVGYVDIENFEVSSSSIIQSQPVTLSWNVKNGEKVMLYPDGIDVTAMNGRIVLHPDEPTDYRLEATDGVDTLSTTLHVYVQKIPHLTYSLPDFGDSFKMPRMSLIVSRMTDELQFKQRESWLLKSFKKEEASLMKRIFRSFKIFN